MPQIIVSQPFSLRFNSDDELRAFSAGKHEITNEELKNWYIKACIDSGSIVLVGEISSEKTEQEFVGENPDTLVEEAKEPVTEEPLAEEPEEPLAEEPEEPLAEEPEEPLAEEPEEPLAEEPEEPLAEEPTKKSGKEKKGKK